MMIRYSYLSLHWPKDLSHSVNNAALMIIGGIHYVAYLVTIAVVM